MAISIDINKNGGERVNPKKPQKHYKNKGSNIQKTEIMKKTRAVSLKG